MILCLMKFQFLTGFFYTFVCFTVVISYIVFVSLLCSQLEKATMILRGLGNEEMENDAEKWQKFKEFVRLHVNIIK